MQRAILIKTGHGTCVNGSVWYSFDGDFHAVFPEFHLAVRHQFVQFTGRQLAQTHRQFKRQIGVILELTIGQIIIARDDDLRFRLGDADAFSFLVFRDIGRQGGKQLGFITARRFGVACDNGFDLIRRKRGEVDVLCLQVFRHHRRHIVRGQRRSKRTARRFLIGHDKGSQSFGRKRGNVYTLLLGIARNVGYDFIRLQQRYIRPGSQLLVTGHQTLRNFRRQPGYVCAACDLGVLFNVGNQPLGREGCGAGAFGNLGISRDEGVHLHLLILSGQTGNNRFRRDHTGVSGKLIPSRLRAGHVEVGGDLENLFGQRFSEHAVEARQIGLDEIKVIDNARELVQLRGKVNVREQRLHLGFAHAAVQKRLDLGHHRQILRKRPFVHAGRQRLQICQQRGLFAFAGHAVLAQFGKQLVYLLACFLDFRLVPYGHDDGRKRFGVFLRGGAALLVVTGVESIQRSLFFRRILDQLNERIFFIISLINLRVDRRHALGSGFDSVFVNAHVRIRFAARLGTGNLCFHLLGDGGELVRLFRRQVVLDLDSFTGINELLQPDFVLLGEIPVLPFFQQTADLRIHLIQRLDIRCNPLRYAGIADLVGSILEILKLRARAVCQRFEGVRPVGDDLIAFLFAVRPHRQQSVHPLLCGLSVTDKVAFRHAEEGKSRTVAIECLGCGVLPLVGGFLHSLESLPRLLRAGHIIRQRHGARDHCCGDSEPYGGRLAQNRQKPLPAAARLTN